MAIKRLKNVASTKVTAKASDYTGSPEFLEPTTIDREEMKKRLGKLKGSDKQVSTKQVSAKQTSTKQVSAKPSTDKQSTDKQVSPKQVSPKQSTDKQASPKQSTDKQSTDKEMDLRTMQSGLERMLTIVVNMTKEFAEIVARVSALEKSVDQRFDTMTRISQAQSEVTKELVNKISDLYNYVEDPLEEDDEDEADGETGDNDGDDEDADEGEADDCEEGDEEDDCEESEEDDDEDEEEEDEGGDDDEGDDDEDDDELDLDPANYTPEDVMEILNDFDSADLKEIVDEVKERLELTRSYSLKVLLKDEKKRGVILQVINEFTCDENEDEDEDEDE